MCDRGSKIGPKQRDVLYGRPGPIARFNVKQCFLKMVIRMDGDAVWPFT